MSADNTAYVFIWCAGKFVPAGVIHLVEEGNEVVQCQFQYETDYLDRPDAIPVDPVSLPTTLGDVIVDSPLEFRIFPSFLDQIPDAWGQKILFSIALEKNASVNHFDLIVSGGKNRIGALAYGDTRDSPRWDYPLQPNYSEASEQNLEEITEAHERFLREGYHDLPRICKEYISAGSSVGGARPKTLCNYHGKPVIAKFKAPDDNFNVCRVEYATLKLAASLGMRVPPVSIVPMGKRDVFIIDRFDRKNNERIHIVSAATMIKALTGFVKLGTYSYQEIAQAMNLHCSIKYLENDREELFRRMVFNILVANEDDHLRNHSFIYDGTGWRLSPLYDVVPGFHGPKHLYLSVGNQGSLMSLSNALSQCEAFGIYRAQAIEIVQEMVAEFITFWKDIFLEAGVPSADMGQLARLFDMTRLAERETDPEMKKLIVSS